MPVDGDGLRPETVMANRIVTTRSETVTTRSWSAPVF